MIGCAEFMNGFDHDAHVRRVNLGMNTVAEIEDMSVSRAESRQNRGNLPSNPLG